MVQECKFWNFYETIRIGSGKNVRVDGEHLDLQVEHREKDKILAVILTKLPNEFSLETGASIDVYEEEILYKADVPEH